MSIIKSKVKLIILIVILIICTTMGIIIGICFVLQDYGIIDMADAISSDIELNMDSIDLNVNDKDIEKLMAMSDKEVWKLLTGKEYSSKPTSSQVTQENMTGRMTTISVKTRTANGDTTTSFQVNKALAGIFTAFFNDLYNECPDFYIHSDGGYVYRDVRGSAGRLSAHAFGAAIDINASQNPQGAIPPRKIADVKKDKNYVIACNSKIVQIAKKYTLCWGGYFSSNQDGMHFSFIGDWTRAQTISKYSS